MSGDPSGLTASGSHPNNQSDPNFVTNNQSNVQMNGHGPMGHPAQSGQQPSFDEFGSAMNNDMVSIFTC